MPFTLVAGTRGSVLVSASSVGEVTKWALRKKTADEDFQSSETGGYSQVYVGPKSATGSVEFKYDVSAGSPITEGTACTLVLNIGNSGKAYTVPAKIISFQVECDIDTGKVVGGSAEFKNNGPWTEPS